MSSSHIMPNMSSTHVTIHIMINRCTGEVIVTKKNLKNFCSKFYLNCSLFFVQKLVLKCEKENNN